MSCTRSKIVALAQSWVGMNEADGSHKKIIDIYNSHKPRPRNHKLQYDEPWCAGAASALAIACNAIDIIPIECSCSKMIEIAKAMGIWVEADNYIPKPADFLLYDWQDKGNGDNTGIPDHIGIVEAVVGYDIIIIEGNYKNSVRRRSKEVDGMNIRGFIAPHYDEEKPVEVEEEKLVVETPVEEKPVEQTKPEHEKCSLFALIIRAILKLLKGG